MIRLLKSNFDKLLLVLAAVVLGLSGAWTWQQQAEVRRLRTQAVMTQLAGASYELANLCAPDLPGAVWPKAPSQSHGGGWFYEVFTPPVIYYNTLANSFDVTAPGLAGESGLEFGIELLDVKREQYRLQLVGYIGRPGDYHAAFVSPNQPETLLVREGRRLAELDLTLKSFEVKRILIEHGDAWPVYDIVALAVLLDDRTGADVVLDSRARTFTDTPLAVLLVAGGKGKPRELHEGDTFSDEASTYRVEHIQLDPPEVIIARQMPGLLQSETKILQLAFAPKARDQLTAQASTQFPDRPATGLATTDR